MTNTLNHLAWLENNGPLQDIFCVSFVRRLDPPEVLRRFGADAGEQLAFAELNSRVAEYVGQTQGGNGGGHVGVVSCGEWSVAIEPFGWRGNLPEVIAGLSKESEVVAVNRHDFAEAHFVHAVDGTVMTGFAPRMPSRMVRERAGSVDAVDARVRVGSGAGGTTVASDRGGVRSGGRDDRSGVHAGVPGADVAGGGYPDLAARSSGGRREGRLSKAVLSVAVRRRCGGGRRPMGSPGSPGRVRLCRAVRQDRPEAAWPCSPRSVAERRPGRQRLRGVGRCKRPGQLENAPAVGTDVMALHLPGVAGGEAFDT